MALTDYMIAGVPSDAQTSNFTMNGMGNRGQPDIPNLPADEMKEVMDELVTKVIAPAFNAALAEIAANLSVLAPFISTPRSVISDETASGVQTSDIPNVAALRAAINAAVIAAGAADMTKEEYADGQPTGVVSHAALADLATNATNATDATNAATATNATKLNNQAASYYATAAALASTNSSVTTLTNRKVNGHALSSDVTVTKSDVGLGNVDDVKQMPIAGGTFTGNAAAISSNRTTSGLRNIEVRITSATGTLQSTNKIIMVRK